MPDVVIVDALRRRTGLEPAEVGDVVWGCVSQAGEQAGNLARTVVLATGQFAVPRNRGRIVWTADIRTYQKL